MLLDWAAAVLLADVKLILARFVREVGDVLAVGRPGWIALGHPRRAGEVPDIAFLGGHGEDFPVGLEDSPRAAGREASRADLFRDLHKVRAHGSEVTGHANVERPRLAAFKVKQVQRAELLVHDGAGICRGRLDIKAMVFYELTYFLACRVEDEQRHRPITIGQEINLGA